MDIIKNRTGDRKRFAFDKQDFKTYYETIFEPEELKQGQASSPINRMFDGRSIFITGASGFVGRVLLEKLLRTYPKIKKIYILLRPKKGQDVNERLEKLLDVALFDPIRWMENSDEILKKIHVIPGDIGKKNLGISEQDMDLLLNDKTLSIVFHSAATIRFEEPIRKALILNLIGTKYILEFCKKLTNLIGLCHVSTAYVNSNIRDGSDIEEKIYPFKGDYKELIRLCEILDEDSLQLLRDKLVGEYPNTYVYTKAATENMILNEASELPVVIVRPSLVTPTCRDPFPGWIDNLNGLVGLSLIYWTGVLRVIKCSEETLVDGIPVDITVNSLISSLYYIAKINNLLPDDSSLSSIDTNIQRDELSYLKKEKMKHVIVHSNGADLLVGIKSIELFELFMKLVHKYPSIDLYRYPYAIITDSQLVHDILAVFLHWIPAYSLDFLATLVGQQPVLVRTYKTFYKARDILSPFDGLVFKYKTKNLIKVRDSLTPFDKKQLFMDIESFDWVATAENAIFGVRLVIRDR